MEPSDGRDRRKDPRFPLALPVGITGQDGQDWFGMLRDVSSNGALVSTPSRFRIGEGVTLRLRLRSGDHFTIAARIIRLQVDPHDETEVFRYLAAFRFTERLRHRIIDLADIDSRPPPPPSPPGED